MKFSIQLLVAVFLTLSFELQTLNCVATTSDQQAKQLLSNQNEKGFIENQGQWHSDILYLARMNGLDAWITKKGVNYTFYKLEEVSTADNEKQILPHDKFDHKDYSIIGHRVLVNLQNNNLNPTSEGKQKQEGYYNYLIGNDRSKHASSVSLYNEVVVKNVYQGIDMRYYFDKGSLRYDYVVQPGADPSQIEFKLHGQYKTYLQENNLIFTTRFGEVLITELKTFQHTDRKEISSHFVRTNNDNWSITVGNYDRSQPLIIDPLIYSTFIGGSGNDFGIDIAIDSNRNAYITGYTYSTDYDTTTGAFQTTSGVDYDVFVTKLNTTGAALIYSTYIGGNGADQGASIAIDGSGNTYITGRTNSTNYPVTIGAFQTTNTGSWDVFITKLNASGNNLMYSTYIGGNGNDMGTSIAIDTSGNAYITGEAYSTNFPVTTGAFQTIRGGWDSDNFVTKLNTSGTSLVYSTYIGGSKKDISNSIALDNNENVYITGYTYSTDYPVTSGSYQTFFGGGVDVFVTKLNTSGTALIYSTYIGGGSNNIAIDIAIDGSGNAYVSGETINPYPVTAGAYQTTYGGGGDVFVTKLNPTGTTLVYSTFIGGSNLDQVHSIVLDNIGNAYITGQTESTNYPVTAGAYQTNHGGGFNAVFVTKLNAIGSNLTYSTYIGGINSDKGYGITIDGSNNAYVTGVGLATYPTTFGAYQTTHGGGYDIFVTKLCMEVSGSVALTSSPGSNNQTVCINSPINNITYTTTGGATGATFSGLPTGTTGSWANNTITISGTPAVSGTFNYTITLTSNCNTITDTGSIIVYPNATSTDLQIACNSLTWIDGITYTSSTTIPTFTIIGGAENGCDSIVALNLTITTIDNNTSLNSDTISANQVGATYQWLDCDNGNAAINGETSQSFIPTITGNYAVKITLGSCVDTSSCVNVIITGIEELIKAGIRIYPNPINDNIIIELANTLQNTEVNIVSTEGKVVYHNSTINSNKFIIDAAAWSKGMYVVNVISNRGTQSLQLIKQ